MNLHGEIINWVEYTICEKAMIVYYKSNSLSNTFRSFCERLRDSIMEGNLNKNEENILNAIMANANREYCLPIDAIGTICANFYINRRWEHYIMTIELMKTVKCRLPDNRFSYF